MGVTTKTTPVTTGNHEVKVKAKQADPESYNLELKSIQRYHYGNVLYLAGTVYVFDVAGAKHMLALKDRNLPVFTLARKRTKMVAVPVEQGDEHMVAVEQTIVAKVDNGPAPLPRGAIDLGDDDEETRARLAALDDDSNLLDTGAGVQLT